MAQASPCPLPCPTGAPQPATLAGRYEVRRPLGRGASGSTFLALDRQLGRLVALKLLDCPGVESLARFRREAWINARLRHPAIVVLHELHGTGAQPFLVMEPVDGGPLTRGGFGKRRMLEVARTIADALRYAHAQGVIHCDLKPENILIDLEGNPHLIDFGLALDLTGRSGDSLSLRGDIEGTPWCMAPEQAAGRLDLVDARSDIWALGATLYWGLTGSRPFEGETLVDLLHAVMHDEPPSPRALDPRISPGVERILLRCLCKRREDRYASAAELIRDLDRVLARRATESHSTARRLQGWLRRALDRHITRPH